MFAQSAANLANAIDEPTWAETGIGALKNAAAQTAVSSLFPVGGALYPAASALENYFAAPVDPNMPSATAALGQGIASGIGALGQTVETARGEKPTYKPDENLAAAPLGWSDLEHPIASGLPKVAYRFGESSPTLAGAVAGGLGGGRLGSLAGPEGTVLGSTAGSAIGAGVVSAAQTLGPYYAQALKANPNNPAAAYDAAKKAAYLSGAFSAAGWALFDLPVFEGPVKSMLFQAFVAQPAVAVTQKATTNVTEGRPASEGLGEAAVEGVVGTLPMGAHAAVHSLHPTPEEPFRDLIPQDGSSNRPAPAPSNLPTYRQEDIQGLTNVPASRVRPTAEEPFADLIPPRPTATADDPFADLVPTATSGAPPLFALTSTGDRLAYSGSGEAPRYEFRRIDKTRLETEADRLTHNVRAFEDELAASGAPPAQIASGIANTFGFPIDPEAIASGNVWWRVPTRGSIEPGQGVPTARTLSAPLSDNDRVSILQLTRSGVPPPRIAEELGLDPIKVAAVVQAAKPRPIEAPRDYSQLSEIQKLYTNPDLAGLSAADAADRVSKVLGTDVTERAIYRARQRAAEKGAELPPMAGRSASVWTDDAIAALHDAKSRGLTDEAAAAELSAKLGSDLTVNAVRKRLSKSRNDQTAGGRKRDEDLGDLASLASSGRRPILGASEDVEGWLARFRGLRNARPSDIATSRGGLDQEGRGIPGGSPGANEVVGSSEGSAQPGGASGRIGDFGLGRYRGLSVETPNVNGLRQRRYFLYPESSEIPSSSRSPQVAQRVLKSSSNWVAKAHLSETAPGQWGVLGVNVRKNRQRRGIGGQLYDALGRDVGVDLGPSPSMTRKLYDFWRTKRDAGAVRDYQRIGDKYYSPDTLRSLKLVNDEILRAPTSARELAQAKRYGAQIDEALTKVSGEPPALSSMARGAKEELGLKKSKPNQEYEGFAPPKGAKNFDYEITKDGKPTGMYAHGYVSGDTAHIDWLGDLDFESGPNALGISGIKQLREALRKDFPNVKNFTGERVSGARYQAGKEDLMQKVYLPSLGGPPPLPPFTPRFRESLPQLIGRLEGFLSKALPPDVATRVAGRLRDELGNELNGQFTTSARLLELALFPRGRYEPDEVFGIAKHELIHALRQLGLFTDKEWASLKKAAADRGIEQLMQKDEDAGLGHSLDSYREHYTKALIDRGYGHHPLFDHYLNEALDQELVARMAQDWAVGKGKYPSVVAGLFNRIKNFIAALHNWMGKNGFNHPDKVFQKAFSGEVAGRSEHAGEPRAPMQVELPSFAKGPRNLQGHEEEGRATPPPIPGNGRAEPPLAPGMVRMYHGGNPPPDYKGPLWFTSSRPYAEGWAGRSPSMGLHYVDIPENHPAVTPEYADQGIKQGFTVSAELPGEIASQRRALGAEQPTTSGRAGPPQGPPPIPPGGSGAKAPKGMPGGAGRSPPSPPGGGTTPPPPPPSGWRGWVADKVDAMSIGDVIRDLQMKATPMAARDATVASRAAAKDFANGMRLARHEWNRLDEWIKRKFTPAEQERMWEAADAESVARQNGYNTTGTGLGFDRLSPLERSAVDAMQKHADETWEAAKSVGIVEGEGLPSYTPRMFVKAAQVEGAPRSLTGIGRNLKTNTPQTRTRKYLTAEQTEAAGKAKLGDEAELVRNIRSLPLATAKLQEAVAGRALINRIKEVGRQTGEDTVSIGAQPADSEHKWFTIDHPAFKVWRPKIATDKDGRPLLEGNALKTVKDEDGNTVMERVPLFVRSDFEGPLQSVLSKDSGKIYRGLMELKGKAMTTIMYSPIIHNAVEWGRALPAMPGKVATFRIYFEGNKAKHDPAQMQEAIRNGLVPIGHQFAKQDITSMMSEPDIKPGRSWTSDVVAAIPNAFSVKAGDAVKRAVDKMGDVWHNTLLWDRVGDLQMGLYTNMRDHMIAKGIDEQTAGRAAAHLANRYAGALPLESMSDAARKIANVVAFSRSFTLGNIGAMKDMLTGLPRDVQAQILRDKGVETLNKVNSYAQRKAIGIVAVDIALMYATGAILQNVVSYLRGDQSLSDIAKGYVDRLHKLLQMGEQHPFDVLNPFWDLSQLSPTSENEPGKEDRVLVGYEKDGSAIYARFPTGKIGEEFVGWATSPGDMMKKKQSTFLKPIMQAWNNDVGFGHKLYNPNPKSLGDRIEIMGRVLGNLFLAQTPWESIKAGYDLVSGHGTPDQRRLNELKTLGPLAGLSFSKGAPGGPAVGELFHAREEHDYAVQQAMPEIRDMIKNGQETTARARMKELGIPPGLQTYYVETTKHPERRLTGRAASDFQKYATPEQKERFDAAKKRAAAERRNASGGQNPFEDLIPQPGQAAPRAPLPALPALPSTARSPRRIQIRVSPTGSDQ